jgi:hypothetical protein
MHNLVDLACRGPTHPHHLQNFLPPLFHPGPEMKGLFAFALRHFRNLKKQ